MNDNKYYVDYGNGPVEVQHIIKKFNESEEEYYRRLKELAKEAGEPWDES